jgi:hypothetical protein
VRCARIPRVPFRFGDLVRTPERRLLAIALVVRVVPAALIYGTDDVQGWETWGRMLAAGTSPYASKYPIAWPPLWLPFAFFSTITAQGTGIPFHFLAKLFPIAADLILLFLLYEAATRYRLRPTSTAMFYALNPVSIYTSAVHGQFDPFPTLCVTMAVLLAGADREREPPRAAAVWLGIGAAFKTWPLLMLPALVASATSMRRRLLLGLITVAIFTAFLLLPWPLVGFSAVKDVLAYRGYGSWWGISSIAALLHRAVPERLFTWVFYAGMAFAALLLLAVRPPVARGVLLLLLTFYVTTPGFGLQYLIWIVPVALIADQRRAVIYSLLAGVVIAIEVAARPYTGHFGEIVRVLPHAGYARAYGGERDHAYTVLDRLPLWLYCTYWWLAVALEAIRDRRPLGRPRTS